jgi:hypothetical protein
MTDTPQDPLSPELRQQIGEEVKRARESQCFLLPEFAERIASLAVKAQWQPIETAPENIAVLVYVNWDRYGIYRAILVNMGTGRHWHSSAWACGRDFPPGYPQPTHWMPLPDPPAVTPTMPLEEPKR